MKVRRLFEQYWPEMCLSMIDGDEDDEMKVKCFAKDGGYWQTAMVCQ